MTEDIYIPEFTPIRDEFIYPTYYELRVWKNHYMLFRLEFTTLKKARKCYKEQFKENEERGELYIEIIKIKPLKK